MRFFIPVISFTTFIFATTSLVSANSSVSTEELWCMLKDGSQESIFLDNNSQNFIKGVASTHKHNLKKSKQAIQQQNADVVESTLQPLLQQVSQGIKTYYQITTENIDTNPQDLTRRLHNYNCESLAQIEEAKDEWLVGTKFYYGDGVPQDFRTALSWFQQAAEKGYTPAHYWLGILYLEGQGITRNHQKAFQSFQKAAERNFIEAQYSMGWLFENGLGTQSDHQKAQEWYQKAANQRFTEAQIALANLHTSSSSQKNPIEAYKWWFILKNEGHDNANSKLQELKNNMNSLEVSEAKRRAHVWRTNQNVAKL